MLAVENEVFNTPSGFIYEACFEPDRERMLHALRAVLQYPVPKNGRTGPEALEEEVENVV